MDLRHFFTASRILIVAGKGGTGKSTVAAAIALSAARAGLRTRLVDFEGPAVEIPDHALLTRETVSPGRALSDYLDSHGLGFVSRRLATTGIVELVASTAPGIDDLLVLGKVKSLANSPDLDLVVVDGPASGHALDMLRAPTHLRRAVPGGPIGHQADEVIEMLADSSRCRTMIVTTPAVTPVHEALEAAHQLAGEFSVALAPVAVNMVDEAPPAIDDAMSLPTHLRDAWTWATTRAQSQASAVAELDTALASHLHVARMLLRRHRLDGVDLIEAMSDDMAAEIERLPESGAT